MTKAAQLLSDQPEGSRHVILITDGVESPGGKGRRQRSDQTIGGGTRGLCDIISYTEFIETAG